MKDPKSPAAAPAAEKDPREDRWANPDLGPMPEFAPPSGPAAPDISAAEFRRDPFGILRPPAHPQSTEVACAPAPLLPRVLAALENVDGGMDMGCASLAAELRAYIAERKVETDLREALLLAVDRLRARETLPPSITAAWREACDSFASEIDAALRRSP